MFQFRNMPLFSHFLHRDQGVPTSTHIDRFIIRDFALITVTEIKRLNAESLATAHSGRDNDVDGWYLYHTERSIFTVFAYPLFTSIATLIIWVWCQHVYKSTVEQSNVKVRQNIRGYAAYGIIRHQQPGTRPSCSGASL